jgi:hypothetical protein
MNPLLNHPISKFLLLTACLYMNASSARAQLNFTLSEPSVTYLANSGGTTIIAANTDDGSSGAVNIGFSFTYGCNTYTQFVASSNGWISLGNNTAQAYYNNDLTTTGQGPILAPLWDDLKTSSTGKVNYVLSGTAPNRVLTIEWLNMLWDLGAGGPVISFQVKLYETSNLIDFTYKQGTTGVNNSSSGASIGLNGGSSAGDFYSLAGVSATQTVNYGPPETNSISSRPLTNQVYRWTPAAMAYTSGTTAVASAATISKCTILNQVILGVQVVTLGCANPKTVTQFQINMTGSTAPTTDVTAIHIYYTGNSAVFAPTGEFKAGGTTPAAGTITVTGSQVLSPFTNYFWIAYDISSSAVPGDQVDAQCTQLTCGGANKTPSAIVTGLRTIVACSAPGGIANMAFWVKANAGTSTTANGGSLSTWNDQSGNARNASSPASGNNPTYYDNSTNNINFNPVVNFNASSQAAATASYMTIPSNGILSTGNNPYEVYAVVAPGAGNLGTPGKFLFAGSGLNGFNAFDARAGNAFNDTWDVNDLTVSGQWTTNYPSLAVFDFNSVQREMFISGGSVGTKVASNRTSTDANDALGCQVVAAGTNIEFYDGGIAEIITYPNTSHAQATRSLVESYLGIKYGITLLHDYVASNGSTVWSLSKNASYNNNIIGIARDDGALSQKQSKSTSVTPDMLTMYVGTKQTNQAANTGTFTAGDKSFFMAGNNGVPYEFTSSNTDVPAGICCRLQRVWLSQKTNFTNTDLTLQFDFNSINPGTPLFASDLRLLVDDNGVFSNATILATTTITVASAVVTVVVPASSITSAQPYFTLASAAVRTPLPVTIDAFSASCLQKNVQVNWTMGSAGNNSFTIERSGGAGNFVPVGVVASDQSVLQSYTWTDGSPLPGVSAYRLKVTDNNSNTVSYSTIASVSGCVMDNSVFIVSDPTTGKASMLVIRLPQRAVVDIGFYDVLGHQLSVPGLTGRHTMDPGVYNLSVPSQNLVTGVYFLSVTINNEKRVYRVIL